MPSLNQSQQQHNKPLFDFKERDILSNDGDFIMFTSNNLDYLKAHSAFNSSQLNFYPTLSSNYRFEALHKWHKYSLLFYF